VRDASWKAFLAAVGPGFSLLAFHYPTIRQNSKNQSVQSAIDCRMDEEEVITAGARRQEEGFRHSLVAIRQNRNWVLCLSVSLW